MLGFLLDYFYGRIRGHKKDKATRNQAKSGENNNPEVILTIFCESSQYEMVEKVLWDNMAFGVGKLDRLSNSDKKGYRESWKRSNPNR